MKSCKNAKHEEHYFALMYNTQRNVDECRIQKVGENMKTAKQVRIVETYLMIKDFFKRFLKSILMMRSYIFSKD